jgi:DNA-binding response OmpR family regulator
MANILIIDDQPYLAELLSGEFSEGQHYITCVENSWEVMKEFRSCRFDIVLLDLYLQGFEGWDLLHRLKLKEPGLPVLIVTTYDNFTDDPRLAEADGYVIKEIYTDKLKKKIEEVLGQKSRWKGGLNGHSNFRQRRQDL